MVAVTPVAVLMRMVVVVPVLMMMIVTMIAIGAVPMLTIRALLRIERRFDRREPRAEPAQHILDHMIAAQAQPITDDLHLDVTIADMPGEPRQFVAAGGGNFDQRLRPADDAHDAAIIENETITVTERGSLRQVEQEGGAALAGQNDATAIALMRIERNLIDGASAVPMARGLDGMRAFHLAHKACC